MDEVVEDVPYVTALDVTQTKNIGEGRSYMCSRIIKTSNGQISLSTVTTPYLFVYKKNLVKRRIPSHLISGCEWPRLLWHLQNPR